MLPSLNKVIIIIIIIINNIIIIIIIIITEPEAWGNICSKINYRTKNRLLVWYGNICTCSVAE